MSTALVHVPRPVTKLRPCKVSGHDWWIYSYTHCFDQDRTFILRCKFCGRKAKALFRFAFGALRDDVGPWIMKHAPEASGSALAARVRDELLATIHIGAGKLVS